MRAGAFISNLFTCFYHSGRLNFLDSIVFTIQTLNSFISVFISKMKKLRTPIFGNNLNIYSLYHVMLFFIISKRFCGVLTFPVWSSHDSHSYVGKHDAIYVFSYIAQHQLHNTTSLKNFIIT